MAKYSRAIYTRQRHTFKMRFGYECQEERDYFPYWHPSPWIDIAVLPSDPESCASYQAESQNVKEKGECSIAAHNNMESCMSGNGKWEAVAPHGVPPPVCEPPRWNGDEGTFNWTLPQWLLQGKKQMMCVLRVRCLYGEVLSYPACSPARCIPPCQLCPLPNAPCAW